MSRTEHPGRHEARVREFQQQLAAWEEQIGPWLAGRDAPPEARPHAPQAQQPYVTPLVRATAERLRVDLRQVKGTGTGGRIRPADVRAASTTRKDCHG